MTAPTFTDPDDPRKLIAHAFYGIMGGEETAPGTAVNSHRGPNRTALNRKGVG